jgi:hypothetical protein
LTSPFIDWDIERYPHLWKIYLKNLDLTDEDLLNLDAEEIQQLIDEGPVKQREDVKLRRAMRDGVLRGYDTRLHTFIKYHDKFHDKLSTSLGKREETWKIYSRTERRDIPSARTVVRYPSGTIINGVKVGGRIRTWKLK